MILFIGKNGHSWYISNMYIFQFKSQIQCSFKVKRIYDVSKCDVDSERYSGQGQSVHQQQLRVGHMTMMWPSFWELQYIYSTCTWVLAMGILGGAKSGITLAMIIFSIVAVGRLIHLDT